MMCAREPVLSKIKTPLENVKLLFKVGITVVAISQNPKKGKKREFPQIIQNQLMATKAPGS